MLISMTGFGRAEVPLFPRGRAVVEVQTLNHRFLEVECRLPEGFQGFERSIRGMASEAFHRGRVRLSVFFKERQPLPRLTFQDHVIRQYFRELKRSAKEFGIREKPLLANLLTLFTLPHAVTYSQEDASYGRGWPSLKKGVSIAIAGCVRMRRKEGKRLSKVLAHLARQLSDLNAQVQRRAPVVQAALQKRWKRRIQRIARTSDPKTVAIEAANLVRETDASEESARIRSHLVALRQALAGRAESPGRTIDFLAQELQREVNTLGAKLRDAQVIKAVVAMKDRIEKIRQQASNVE